MATYRDGNPENPFEWERLPTQKIFQHLQYPDILRITSIIRSLKKAYTKTDELTQTKFIFDHSLDNPKKLVTCRKLRQIYLKNLFTKALRYWYF